MFKRLIASLTLDYEFVARGRGILTKDEMDLISRGDRMKVEKADKILPPVGVLPTLDDQIDLKECGLIANHIDEMCEWIDQLSRTEIV